MASSNQTRFALEPFPMQHGPIGEEDGWGAKFRPETFKGSKHLGSKKLAWYYGLLGFKKKARDGFYFASTDFALPPIDQLLHKYRNKIGLKERARANTNVASSLH